MGRIWAANAVALGMLICGACSRNRAKQIQVGNTYTLRITLQPNTSPTDCNLSLILDPKPTPPSGSTAKNLILIYNPGNGIGDAVRWIDATQPGSPEQPARTHRIVVTFAVAQSNSPFGTADFTAAGGSGLISSPPANDPGSLQATYLYEILYNAGVDANGKNVVCLVDPMIIVKR